MDDQFLAKKIQEWMELKSECDKLQKAREDKLIPSSQRSSFRQMKQEFAKPDLLSEHKETVPGVSSVGIEARRGDERVKGVISHGYARVSDPSFHKEKSKNIARQILNHLKTQPKPNLPKSENLDKASYDPNKVDKEKKIKDLQHKIDQGTYKPDPSKIAEKIIDKEIKKSSYLPGSLEHLMYSGQDGSRNQSEKKETLWPEDHRNYAHESKYAKPISSDTIQANRRRNGIHASDGRRSHYHSNEQMSEALKHLDNNKKVTVESVGFGRRATYLPEHADIIRNALNIKKSEEIKKSDHEDIVAGVKLPSELKIHQGPVPREHQHRELAAKFVTDVWRKNKHEGMRMSQKYLGSGLTHEKPLSNNPNYSTVKSETKPIPADVSEPLKINRVDMSAPITQSGPTVINSYKNEEGTRASGEFMLVSDIIGILKNRKLNKAKAESALDDVSKQKVRLDRQGKNIFTQIKDAKVNPKDPVMQYDIKKEKKDK